MTSGHGAPLQPVLSAAEAHPRLLSIQMTGHSPISPRTPLTLITAWTLAPQSRPQLQARASIPATEGPTPGGGWGGRGCLTFAPSTQLSPQGNQDCNHNSKDRLVLLFSFFFLKGVRAWKIQHTNETKGQKKKIQKKIENRKMYLQVVHYYDQKAQRHLLL